MTYENMTRRRVLCYGDSNTYGYDPARDGRYGDDERYPMVLQNLLGDGWSVVEEGLPGRTAVFDDAITEGMNGLALITPILMSHAPLDTVTIMLGTNDSKNRFDCSSYLISLGIVRLVHIFPFEIRFFSACNRSRYFQSNNLEEMLLITKMIDKILTLYEEQNNSFQKH